MTNFLLDKEIPFIIPCQDVQVEGLLYLPTDFESIILFVHGSGSSRFSPRNQHVARIFNNFKFGTLLFDLLTPEEENVDVNTSEYRFDIPLLASRLVKATDWCAEEFPTKKIAYFGASTGAAAALVAASKKTEEIKAIVSRGGRPDLAGDLLSHIHAPTLFIVGEYDLPIIETNEIALSKMQCIKKLEIVPGATHLFEEPGTLDIVARLSTMWFLKMLNLRK
jgi:pimeloyl-ACP methyl ester carboxylesterase